MDTTEAKERLLEAVRKGETIVAFSDTVRASVSPQGDVYKVEATGFHPVGFPHWDEETSVASWEGPEVDEAAKKVVDALAGVVPAAMMQETVDKQFKPPSGWNDPKSWLSSAEGADKIREKAWAAMGSTQHTCAQHMEGRVDDPDAFCAALKDAIVGDTHWRKGGRKKEVWETVEEGLEELVSVEKVIVEEPGEIVIYSEDRSKVLGRFPYGKGKKYANKETAKEAAEKRLRQIEFFKHQKKEGEWLLDVAIASFDTTSVFSEEASWQKEPTARMFLAAAKAYVQRKESEAIVWQEGDRRFYLGLVSLPSIKDREGEVVTAEGADFSIKLAQKYGYKSGLYIKHVVPQSLVGRMLSERRIGPFWVEFGEFKSTLLADWAYRVLENDKEGKWRFSIGFLTPKKQAMAGRYTRLLKFDSTITEVPAQPLTAMLALVKGGSAMNQSVNKLMTFLNPETDGEKAQVTKMLAELFDVEEKELTVVSKQSEEAREAVEALPDDNPHKAALLKALEGEEEEPTKKKKKKKGEEEEESDEETATKEAVKEAIMPLVASLKDLTSRLEAVEASAGSAALKELRDALLTRAKDYPKPSDTAPAVPDAEALLKRLEQVLNPGSGGKHPLSGFAGGPSQDEGG